MAIFVDLRGKRYGRLTVIERAGNKWRCKCDCGNYVLVQTGHLNAGTSQSCGCWQKELTAKMAYRHGGVRNRERLYVIWQRMKERCYNSNYPGFGYHGGRGIIICDEWLSDYESFRCWALKNGYKDNLTIDRIDNDGNYTPENCRWATTKEQNNNTRANRHVIYNGKRKTVSEWAEEIGIEYDVLLYRILAGWDVNRAMEERVRPYVRKNVFS